MARVISVYNVKGGVGKTTTSVNLAAQLAASGKKTLVVDFDPQANATSTLGVTLGEGEKNIYHGIFGRAFPQELLKNSKVENLTVVPSSPELAGALVELVGTPNREYVLRRVLGEIKEDYDYVLIDLAPSMSLLTINALTASDEVLIPIQAEYLSLEGLRPLLRTLDLLRDNLRHPVRVAGALLTMVGTENFNREIVENVRAYFPYTVFQTEIPRSIALAESPSFGVPVLLHRPYSKGSEAYRRLANEIMGQERIPFPNDTLYPIS